MLTPLILFLGLTVATAVIAYWSDNLGKKLGKKRVTLMGLRPRTTATVLTITSSWAIMLFTLAVLLAVVTPLRNALFRYDRERAQFREDISKAETRLSGTQNRLSKTQKSLSTANTNLSQLQTDLKQADFDIKTAKQAAYSASQGAKQARAGEKQAQNRAKAAQSRVETALEREREAQRGEREAKRLQREARRDLASSRSALGTVRVRFGQTQSRLNRTRNQLTSVETELKKAAQNLNLARGAESRARGAAQRLGPLTLGLSRQTIALTRQRDVLTQQRDKLSREVRELEAAAQIYSVAAVQLLGGNVKIAVGRTFAAQIIPARESPARIEVQLRQILAQGQAAFATFEETAPLYEQGARLILFPLPEKGGDNTPLLRGLSQLIAANPSTTSVRLVAAFNSTAEEKQIAVRFIAVPVALAFRAGETLASATITGTGGDARVFGALNNLIEMGREEAIKRNVNPPLTLAEPNFYAEGTSVGLFEALRRIEASHEAKRVRLVAAQELSTVEPLRVRFEVENVPIS
ncbi:MAG TPA: DUF3084 domain-containing protein [Abditibacterium sp.]|jgi:uncharacterized protein (DUF3084 family)